MADNNDVSSSGDTLEFLRIMGAAPDEGRGDSARDDDDEFSRIEGVPSIDDGSTAAIMALGGKGVISVAANVVPREMHELTQLCLKNRFLEAGALQLKLHELIRALFCEVNPIPVKAAMELLGLCSGELRLPLCRISERHLEQLSHALEPFRPAV